MQIPSIFFCALIAVAKDSNAKLKKKGDRGHPCLTFHLTIIFLDLYTSMTTDLYISVPLNFLYFPIPNLPKTCFRYVHSMRSNTFSAYKKAVTANLFFFFNNSISISFLMLSFISLSYINPVWSFLT